MRADLRRVTDNNILMLGGFTIDFTYNPSTARLTGMLDITEPVTLTPFATAFNAGRAWLAAGSWIRATLLTVPFDYYYGNDAIGGQLL